MFHGKIKLAVLESWSVNNFLVLKLLINVLQFISVWENLNKMVCLNNNKLLREQGVAILLTWADYFNVNI